MKVAESIGKTMAKTYKHTYERICDRDNIRAALFAAAKGKRHKKPVQYALAHEDETVERIREILVSRSDYLPSPRSAHEINDGIKAKRRVIVHPSFTEQIIDHCLIQIIGPHFASRFFRWSCGSIPGRGQEGMVKHLIAKVRKHQERVKYYAVLDVAKCFDTADADAVYKAVAKREADKDTLALIRYKLDANAVRLSDGSVRKGGVPIGVFTSPWFANIALDSVDKCFKDDGAVYLCVRFMDDIFVAHGNKRELKRAIDAATRALAAFGLTWKTVPVIRKWAYGDIGKVRFCGVQFTRETMEVRDVVYLRAVRSVGRIAKKIAQRKRATWYDASKVISYGGRFAAFESWNAYRKKVLQGNVTHVWARQKVSAHDKLKSRSTKNV